MPAAVSAGADARFLRLGSSFRERAPEATLRQARRLMPSLGISRVTDITRLDRLGLPVFVSVRPRGRALCVHAGKGLQAIDAEVGALMEAVECAVADPARLAQPLRSMTVAEIAAQFDDGPHYVDFAPRLGLPIDPTDRVPVVACDDLRRARRVQLPAELVFLPFVPPPGASHFAWSSNGLASGNSLEEASLHALLEVLERDAVAMHRARDASHWVEADSLPRVFRGLAARWRAAGIRLGVRYLPNDFGLPCFEACLHESQGSTVTLSGGSGLHLHRAVALSRAICEAAQSRLGHIHGGRDDVVQFYAGYSGRDPVAQADDEAALARRAFDRRRRMHFAAVPQRRLARGASIAEVFDGLRARLARRGFGDVFRHRFASTPRGLHVVKLVVPRCEDLQQGCPRMGPRLLDRVLRRA